MSYIPQTPFRRTAEFVQITAPAKPEVSAPAPKINKWHVLRELGIIRKRLGLSDRNLSVLQALLSFHKGDTLVGDLVVFASNNTICKRLNGMPCSTMRRHLAALVSAGLLIRRDSPNGKRYVRRKCGVRQAFGFDLAPLADRYAEFCELSENITRDEARISQARQDIILMRRDLLAFAEQANREAEIVTIWERSDRCLKRSSAMSELLEIQAELDEMMKEYTLVNRVDEGTIPLQMSTDDDQIEHHQSRSKKEDYDKEKSGPAEVSVSLSLVLTSCTAIRDYADGPIRNWSHLRRAAELVFTMMGITQDAWENAKHLMGYNNATVVVTAMLERFKTISFPNAYLRHLSNQAARGEFSLQPLLMSLDRQAWKVGKV